MSKLPRLNVYVCEYNCLTVTVDVDEGVTPFMIGCRSRSRPDRPIKEEFLTKDGFCKGSANSRFYPKVPKPPHIKDPEWEWYKPTELEIEAEIVGNERQRENILEHWRRGGLFLRPRTDKQPIFHEEKTI